MAGVHAKLYPQTPAADAHYPDRHHLSGVFSDSHGVYGLKIFGIMHKTYAQKSIYINLLNSLPLTDRAELGRVWREILIVYHLYL